MLQLRQKINLLKEFYYAKKNYFIQDEEENRLEFNNTLELYPSKYSFSLSKEEKENSKIDISFIDEFEVFLKKIDVFAIFRPSNSVFGHN